MYKIGWCGDVESAAMLAGCGYDFIECPLVSLALEEPDVHKTKIQSYKQCDLPVLAVNCFFPGDLKVVGGNVDSDRIDRYLTRAAEALAGLGTKIAVLGSGGARKIAEGWEYGRAEEQFLDLLKLMADRFHGTGVTVAIEPLNRKECNFINRVHEAAALAKWVNRPEIRVLADFYHMQEEQEALSTLADHREWLAHIHLADTGRYNPGSGSYPYPEFLEQLGKAGYKGMLSAECHWNQSEDEPVQSLHFIDRMFNNKGTPT